MLRIFGRYSQRLATKRSPGLLNPPRASTGVRSFIASSVVTTSQTETVALNARLSGKLMEELKFEKESIDTTTNSPTFLSEFKDNAPFWKIVDAHSGEKEVVLEREFGNEKIRVLFSLDALNNANDMEEDMDEDMDAVDEGEEGEAPGFSVNLTAIITKVCIGRVSLHMHALLGGWPRWCPGCHGNVYPAE